ncbi:nicotinate-nucleotide--dimethylbenzimidazole phosphoribosyltransferase [Streptomyces typhae]|uniref:nicotinate-nucleotide--dimethylbenzimidazole phosphoribosyltransferase n=1 Tax=Streptomyces typhae TaxID=2681492 RepID=UPI003CCC9864
MHQPGPHETSGRDSGSVDLTGMNLPGGHGTRPASHDNGAAPATHQNPVRRPLHRGPAAPAVPDGSASPVRSLADRGPASGAPHPMPVRHAGPPTSGPEYLDVPRDDAAAVLPGPQLGEIPPQGAAPWSPQPQEPQRLPAETVVPAGAEGSLVTAATPVSEAAVDGAVVTEATAPADGSAPGTPVDGSAPGTPEASEAPAAEDTPHTPPGAEGSAPAYEEPTAHAPQDLATAVDGAEASASAGVGANTGPGVTEPGAATTADVPDAAGQGAVVPSSAAEPSAAEPAATATPEPAPEGAAPLPHEAPAVHQASAAHEAPAVTAPAAADPAPAATAAADPVDPATPVAAAAPSTPATVPTPPGPPVAPGPPGAQADGQSARAAHTPPQHAVAPQAPDAAQPWPDAYTAQGPHLAGAGLPDAAGQAFAAQAPAPLGQFVPVEGSVPTTPHLAPTPPSPLSVPPEYFTPEPEAAGDGPDAPAQQTADADRDPAAVPAGGLPEQAEAAPDTRPGADSAPDATPDAGQQPAATVPAPRDGDRPTAGPAGAAPAPVDAAEDGSPFPSAPATTDPDEPMHAPHPAGPTDPAHQSGQQPAPAVLIEDGPEDLTDLTAPAAPADTDGGPEPLPLTTDTVDPAVPADAAAATDANATDVNATDANAPADAADATHATHATHAPDTTKAAGAADTAAASATDAAAPDTAEAETETEAEDAASVANTAVAAGALREAGEEPAADTPEQAAQAAQAAQAEQAAAQAAPAAQTEQAAQAAQAEPPAPDSLAADPDEAEPLPADGSVEPLADGSVEPPAPGYADAEREAVLRVMRERRDIRNGFRGDPIPHEVLLRVLEAAHTAPSVGHSQPWDFVVIKSAETRRTMHELAQRQREAYAKSLPKGRAKQFKELKIEAILDTPVNIVVTADPTRGGRHTLGRHTQPQMAPYSSALAVENLWLAARAEGLGVGWVSFFDEREMVRALGLPEHLEVVAYLCVGYVDEFPEEPELMQAGWSKRRPLSWVVHEETYGRRALPGEDPHDLLAETVSNIRPLDAKALGEAWERQKRMTKPAGALGMLEIISAQLSGLSRMCPPPIPEPAAVAIFAGDHGVHAQGVTSWPQEVTGQMVANFLGGGAVCNAFANQVGAEVCVIDVGVAGELPATPGLLPRKIRPGTADMTTGPALTREEVKAAIEVGIETARDLVAAGNKALLTGEMGIANTTASAALISVYTDTDPVEVTGRGTGINDEMHARKVEVVRRALDLHQPDPADPVGVLAAIGGLEHAAMVGLLLGGASLRTPVILDGVSAGAAALVARAIAPEVLAACIAGHRSAEPGHVAALNKLGLRPLVDLDLRLGEGTGALLALPVVQSAARAMHEVATFDSAGVTEK